MKKTFNIILLIFIVLLLMFVKSDYVSADNKNIKGNSSGNSSGNNSKNNSTSDEEKKTGELSSFKFKIDSETNANGDVVVKGITIESGRKKGDKDYLSKDVSRGYVWNELLNRYKILIVGFLGLATISIMAFGMYLFTKLGVVADNPKARMETMMGIGICLLCAGLLGTATTIFAYTYNVFR